ncbi:MAG TPA: DUF4465 domain-containing protein, partial [Planctomycetia bacterium]|nr:DUF4465 domain-containing protein [Planctomycetia bacterium]
MIALFAAALLFGFDDANFENFVLSPNSFLNDAGGGANGFFNSGSGAFGNNFSPDFGGIWSGFAVSNVVAPNTPGFGNQYASKPGSGAGGSANYGVGFTFGADADPMNPSGSFVNIAAGMAVRSVAVANTAFAYFSMLNGDQFTQPFSVADQDFFRLSITGYQGLGGVGPAIGTIDFYLADYRT